MFNLNDILQSAQGGQAIQNLAQQFGLSPEQVEAATKVLIPGMSMGLQKTTTEEGGLGSILGHLGDNQHQGAFQDADVAASPETAQKGGDILGQIFGSDHVTDQVAQHAAEASGIGSDLMKQLMPVLASILMGGVSSSMQNQGLGGILGQLAGAAGQGGGLGSILGSVLGGGQQQGAAPAGGGGLGDVLGGLLGGMLGGGQAAAPQAQQGVPNIPGLDSASVQAGMDALGKMFQPGGQQAGGLQDILGQLLGGKR